LWRDARGHGTGLDRFLPPDRTTLFACGREGLAEPLWRAGVVARDTVLLPSFICCSPLASLAALGPSPRFYDVGQDLTTDKKELHRAARGRARAVVAVYYFGFPQELAPFKDWCVEEGARLIEDNAHGFLSSAGTDWPASLRRMTESTVGASRGPDFM
jgi:dTDP-4-amino-4,6-dideoxygalactose transaminase